MEQQVDKGVESRTAMTQQLVKKYGMTVDGVEIQRSKDGYLLAATKDLPANFGFASVPFGNAINLTNLMKASSQVQSVLEDNKQLIDKEGDQLGVVLYLMHMKMLQKQEQWLEISCSTFLDFDQMHIVQTGDEQLRMDYRAAKEAQQKEFKMLWPIIKANQRVFGEGSQEEFRKLYNWASGFVTTRAFGYGMKQLAIIPLFDCLNHTYDQTKQIVQFLLINLDLEREALHTNSPLEDNNDLKTSYKHWNQTVDLHIIGLQTNLRSQSKPPEVKENNSDNDSEDEQSVSPGTVYPTYTHIVLATSDKPCLLGEELYLHYGCRNNSYLLRWYGFCLENNPYDTLKIWLSSTTDAVFFDPIERPTTMFKLKWRSLCLPMINWCRRHFYQEFYKKQPSGIMLWSVPKQVKYELYLIGRLLKRLNSHEPKLPVIEGTQPYVKYLNTYLQERCRMYTTHLVYLNQLHQWLQAYQLTGTPSPFTLSIEPYCRSFVVAMSH